MARLNDPPAPPVESIDVLKRRFIRQNREIARVNSTQSQRIRNLETEISRLLAENISLREQAIAAQTEAERWRSTHGISREILDMKQRLERKVKEVSVLLVEMGELPEKAARRSRRRSGMDNVKNSIDQDWRNRQSIREVLNGERGDILDGRLPVIQEDKLYPRRTLESTEVMALRDEDDIQQASESPELGPPPVAHFDVAEPVAFDAARPPEDQNFDPVVQLPRTLEKRRKRRTSALLQDMPTQETQEKPLAPLEMPSSQLLKSGAKRKLDVSELEEPVLQQSSEIDNFIFQRRQEASSNAPNPGKKASRFMRPPGRENEKPGETKSQSPQKSASTSRKILAPKSTNSPAKRRIHVSEKLTSTTNDQDSRESESCPKQPRNSNLPSRLETHEIRLQKGDQHEMNNFPKTPAPLGDEILSPLSTESPARTAHQTKETAVLNSVEDVLNGSIGRGSRRARAAISYAEPNLRDKMRRPGKELVGAVEGIEKGKDPSTGARSMSVDRGKSEGRSEEEYMVLKVKNETAVGEEMWKQLPVSTKKEEPTSPLRDKERKEREKADSSGETNRGKQTAEHQTYNVELEMGVDRLSIFDPPISSPIEEPMKTSTSIPKDSTKAATAPTARRKTSTSAMGRRHSIQPASSTASNSRSNPPRPSSAASLRSDSISHAGTTVASKDLKRSSSVSSNLRGAEAHTESNPADPAGINSSSRAERISSRRRSMMV